MQIVKKPYFCAQTYFGKSLGSSINDVTPFKWGREVIQMCVTPVYKCAFKNYVILFFLRVLSTNVFSRQAVQKQTKIKRTSLFGVMNMNFSILNANFVKKIPANFGNPANNEKRRKGQSKNDTFKII